MRSPGHPCIPGVYGLQGEIVAGLMAHERQHERQGKVASGVFGADLPLQQSSQDTKVKPAQIGRPKPGEGENASR